MTYLSIKGNCIEPKLEIVVEFQYLYFDKNMIHMDNILVMVENFFHVLNKINRHSLTVFFTT